MKISIVTISFNQAQYLRQCIESVLEQTGCELEYIIVDPGSTDGSREIIESYGDRIIRVFEPDAGPADGLNRGFNRASGDVFGFINSDDYLLPGALRRVTDYFSQKGARYFMTGQGYVEDADGRPARVHPRPMTLTTMLHRSVIIFQQATFFPAQAYFEVQGFNVNNDTCWDYELFIRFLLSGLEHEVVSADLATFRLHANSISGSGRLTIRYLAELDKIFQEILGRERNLKDKMYTQFLRARRELAGLIKK